MENIFITNLKSFLKASKLTQSEFAKTLGVSNASVSNYLYGTSEPSLSFLQNFKTVYGINLDDFLTKAITQSNTISLEEKNLTRFIGNYLMYFYDSSLYIGRASNIKKNILKHAVLCVAPSGNTLLSYACFFKEFDQAQALKNALDQQTSTGKKVEIMSKFSDMVYSGSMETSQSQIFIYLKSFNDQSLIILNNPPSNKKYIGGLGTANSVSRGREHMPSIQYILISATALNLPEGEIYNLLALKTADINVHNESEKLVELLKNLYLNTSENTLALEEFQKRKIFESSLESVIADVLESNIFRFAKVSAKDDDFYYNFIKDKINERL